MNQLDPITTAIIHADSERNEGHGYTLCVHLTNGTSVEVVVNYDGKHRRVPDPASPEEYVMMPRYFLSRVQPARTDGGPPVFFNPDHVLSCVVLW